MVECLPLGPRFNLGPVTILNFIKTASVEIGAFSISISACGQSALFQTYSVASNKRLRKACTHTPTFGESGIESAVELAYSSLELADSTTDFVIVGRLPVSNMSNISTPIQFADSSWPTLVGRLLPSAHSKLVKWVWALSGSVLTRSLFNSFTKGPYPHTDSCKIDVRIGIRIRQF